eukprot:3584095-Rhodomonas_salina.2
MSTNWILFLPLLALQCSETGRSISSSTRPSRSAFAGGHLAWTSAHSRNASTSTEQGAAAPTLATLSALAAPLCGTLLRHRTVLTCGMLRPALFELTHGTGGPALFVLTRGMVAPALLVLTHGMVVLALFVLAPAPFVLTHGMVVPALLY